MSKPRRLPSGRWRIQWFDHSGRRQSATFESQAAAKVALHQRHAAASDIRAGKAAPPAPQAPTLKEFAERWLATYPASVGNRETTLREKKTHVRLHLVPHLGELRLDEVRGEAIDRFFAGLRERGLSEKSVKNVRTTLRTLLRVAVDWDVLPALPRLPKVRPPEPPWDRLTEDEAEALLGATRTKEEHVLLLFALHTGLRAGEQRVIEWGDIDWYGGFVVVRRSLADHATAAGPTKSGRERRVPLSARLTAALIEIRELRHLEAAGLIFRRPDREEPLPYTLSQLHERLWGACRRAGLRRIRWHDLRHTFASLLVAKGVDLLRVKAWLGHSTLAMTERYSHLMPNAGDAIGVLDGLSAHEVHTGISDEEKQRRIATYAATPAGFEPPNRRKLR